MALGERGLEAPWAKVVMAAGMFGPAVAAFAVVRWLSPLPEVLARTGLRLRAPGRRWAPFWIVAWVGPPLLVVISLGVGWALGQLELDPWQLSGFRALIEKTPRAAEILQKISLRNLALAQAALIPVAPVLNAVPCFGEEYGWRGYLLPRLLPLGQWRALVVSGAIWGIWHAPVIARGYNYPLHPRLGVLAMVVFCVLLGILFGWLRLETGSVWPPVIAHGALNGSAGLMALLGKAGSEADTLYSTILGLTGWVLLAALIAFLMVRGRLPVRDAPDEAAAGG